MRELRLTESEAEIFKSLQSTAVGKVLAGYIDKLINSMCDIRTMDNLSEEERKGRLAAVKLLEKFLLERLRLSNESQGENHNQYV